MKKLKYILIGLAVIMIVAFFTKPSDETCRRHAIASVKVKTFATGGENDIMQKMLQMAAEKGINIRDKGLYKTIHFKFGGTNNRIGWAALGMVNLKENEE